MNELKKMKSEAANKKAIFSFGDALRSKVVHKANEIKETRCHLSKCSSKDENEHTEE